MISTTFASILAAAALGAEGPEVVPLWPNGAPGFESRRAEAELAKNYWVRNIHNPSITVYLPPKEQATGAAVVICPGGGHRELVFSAEGVEPARYLNSIGVAAFALKYRLGREQGSPYKPQSPCPRGRPPRHATGPQPGRRMGHRPESSWHHGLLGRGRGRFDGGL